MLRPAHVGHLSALLPSIHPSMSHTCLYRSTPPPAAFGDVLEVKLHKKGAYGFVCFAEHADAVKAIIGTHGSMINNRVSGNPAGQATHQSCSCSCTGRRSLPCMGVSVPEGKVCLQHGFLWNPP